MRHRRFGKQNIAVIAAAAVFATTYFFLRSAPEPELKSNPLGLTEEMLEEAEMLANLEEETPNWDIQKLNLGRNSSFYETLRHAGVQPQMIFHIVEIAKPHLDLGRLPQNCDITLFYTTLPEQEDASLLRVEVAYSRLNTLLVSRSDEESPWVAEVAEAEVTEKERTFIGTVTSNLWDSARTSGMPFELIASLAEVFAWQIDFSRQVRENDRWRLVVMQRFANDEAFGWGDILAAEYVNNGETHSAVMYTNDDGIRGHFAPDGSSMRKLFLRTPIRYARISSKFQRRRFHPILKTYRAHNGVDYAARPGTPIRTVGDGVVTFVGRKGPAGNHIQIRHNSVYETGYSHLQGYAKGVRRGSKVEQGQVIGYVGSTGLATGPHLHFAFYENGRFIDPLGMKFPSADPIAKDRLPEFKEAARLALENLPDWKYAELADATDPLKDGKEPSL